MLQLKVWCFDFFFFCFGWLLWIIISIRSTDMTKNKRSLNKNWQWKRILFIRILWTNLISLGYFYEFVCPHPYDLFEGSFWHNTMLRQFADWGHLNRWTLQLYQQNYHCSMLLSFEYLFWSKMSKFLYLNFQLNYIHSFAPFLMSWKKQKFCCKLYFNKLTSNN